MSTTDAAFVWADLSSPVPDLVEAFYAALFGWEFERAADYRTACLGGRPVAGLYETPERFQAMGMPSFWMSYIAVGSVAATVRAAQAVGGRLELETDDYALIRDPSGAGFTICHAAPAEAGIGAAGEHRASHSLHCSDVALVQPFYRSLFGWRFEAGSPGVHNITSGHGRVAGAVTLTDEARSGFQYWAVFMPVASVPETAERARALGGGAVVIPGLPEGTCAALTDPGGATLFVRERS